MVWKVLQRSRSKMTKPWRLTKAHQTGFDPTKEKEATEKRRVSGQKEAESIF